MKNLNIAYITYYDLRKETAATEHIKQIVCGLAENGHRIWLFVFGAPSEIPSKNITVIPVERKSGPFFDIAVARAVRTVNIPFDLLYLRDFLGASAVVRWAKRKKIPIVIEHNGLMHAETPLLGTFKQKLLLFYESEFSLEKRLRSATLNIVVTPAIADFFSKKYGISKENFVHIPNGADINRFSPAIDKISLRHELELVPADTFWLGYIGAMYPWHILDRVISAFEIIAGERDDVRLLIGGDGPERDRIFSLIDRSAAKNYIRKVSPLRIEESPKYISALDVNIALMDERVAPYCWQVKVNHSAACGVLSIITKCEQFQHLADAGVAVLVDELNPSGIAKAIGNILCRTELDRYGKTARQFVVQNLSWKKIVQKTDSVIKLAIARRNDEQP